MSGHEPVERVEREVCDAEDSSVRGRFASCEAANPEHEFVKVEGFGEVVVGAEPESADSVERSVRGGEHEHHDAIVMFDDRCADGVTVEAGKVAVEDDDVVVVQVELGERIETVVGDVDGHRLVA